MGKLIGAGSLGLVSTVMLMGYFNADVSGPASVIALFLSVGLPALGSAALVRSHLRDTGTLRRNRGRLRRESLEAEILQLAARHGGKLTVLEVVAATATDSQRTEEALESLHMQSLTEIEVSESGVLVYSFPGLCSLSDKTTARPVLDA